MPRTQKVAYRPSVRSITMATIDGISPKNINNTVGNEMMARVINPMTNQIPRRRLCPGGAGAGTALALGICVGGVAIVLFLPGLSGGEYLWF